MVINKLRMSDEPSAVKAAASVRAGLREASEAVETARDIVARVRSEGDDALLELTLELDGAQLQAGGLEVGVAEREAALRSLAGETRDALDAAAASIKEFAERSLPQAWSFEPRPGVTVGQVRRPLQTAGIYVPGGRFAYPSTVLMAGIPARVAGVKQVVFCVPPSKDGSVEPTTLAATALVGECRVFKVGGAQAVAAMAYGTATVPRCQMIAGPGNRYVAAAKKLVSGDVTVDLDAGPSEVVVYGDGSSDARSATADLLAQLEHDPAAMAALVTESAGLMGSVEEELESSGKEMEGTVVLALSASREASMAFINEVAPEHLELLLEDAANVLPGVEAAGCVFLGPLSAVAMGDYVAGPSHVLPTGGTAKRLSGLKAEDFTRVMNVIAYTREGFEADAPAAVLLAELEGLGLHASSIRSRREGA
jgi:histidinol dehydrogenase